MMYSKEVEEMCVLAKGPNHGPAPIPEEGKWYFIDIFLMKKFSFYHFTIEKIKK